MNEPHGRDTGRLALAIGAVAAGSAACLATYFAVQGPLGTINDLGNATVALLSAGLAWRLRPMLSGSTRPLAVGAAVAGAAVASVGSALVISGTTGFLLAGLVSGVGFAGIGGWLMVIARSAAAAEAWPPGVRVLGVVAGALMALGVVGLPGIVLRLDDMATAPAWVWVGLLGWLGIYVAYPAWAIRLGIVATRVGRPAGLVPASRVTD